MHLGEASTQPGVIHQNVNVLPVFGKVRDRRLYIRAPLYIQLEGVDCGSAGRRERLPYFLQRLRTASTDKQTRPFPREGDCGCFADSGARSGDKYGLSLKSSHNFLYPKKRKAALGSLSFPV
jgi:hypothetical protein